MPKVVGHFLIPGQGVKIGGNQPAKREQVVVASPGKKDNQQNGKQKGRYGIADNNKCAAPDIKSTAIVYRFADPKRDRHQINDERTPQPKRNGNRQAVFDKRQH